MLDLAEPVADVASLPEAGTRLPRALRPFRNRAYRRLAVALVFSSFASGVWIVALVWEVIRIGGGPAQMSIVSTCAAVGVLLPALLGGVVADRVPQKSILLCVAGVELVGMTVIVSLSIAGATALWHLALVSFVSGMGMAFYYPAYSAWLWSAIPNYSPSTGSRGWSGRPSARRSDRGWPERSSGCPRRAPP